MDHIGYTLFSIAFLLKTWRLYKIKTNKLLRKKVGINTSKLFRYGMYVCEFPAAQVCLQQSYVDICTDIAVSNDNIDINTIHM